MSFYDVAKDFGLPLVTFFAGMAVEAWRERRRESKTERGDTSKQRAADSPWFALLGNSVGTHGSGTRLQLDIRNDGAPVTCSGFAAKTAGYSVSQWHPTSLPTGETLRAYVDVSAGSRDGVACTFVLHFTDRSLVARALEIHVDVRRSPPLFTVKEVPSMEQ